MKHLIFIFSLIILFSCEDGKQDLKHQIEVNRIEKKLNKAHSFILKNFIHSKRKFTFEVSDSLTKKLYNIVKDDPDFIGMAIYLNGYNYMTENLIKWSISCEHDELIETSKTFRILQIGELNYTNKDTSILNLNSISSGSIDNDLNKINKNTLIVDYPLDDLMDNIFIFYKTEQKFPDKFKNGQSGMSRSTLLETLIILD